MRRALLVLMAGLAGLGASLPVKKQDTAHYWYPAETQNGPRQCTELDPNAPAGTWTYCKTCTNPSDPATSCEPLGPLDTMCGAFCYKEIDRWRCAAQGGGGGGTPFTCSDVDSCCANILACTPPPPACIPLAGTCTSTAQCCEGFCANGTCQLPTCLPVGATCVENADCCTALCVDGVCASPTTTTSTTVVTTTVTTTSVTTTTLVAGCTAGAGVCSLGTDCCSGICAQGQCATQECFVLDPTLNDDANYEWWIAPTQTTLLDATCFCQGTCTTNIIIDFITRAGAAIDFAGSAPPDLLCATNPSTADSVYQPFDTSDTDRILPVGRGLRLKVNSLSGGVDKVSWCIRHAP